MTRPGHHEHAAEWTIDDKLCLITGATSGIGAATAATLARQGAHVLMVARNADRGQTARAAITAAHPAARLDVLTCDLADMTDVRRLARTVADTYGRLDVLINNAGVVNSTRRVTVDGFERTLAVNHLAPFLLTHLLRGPLGTGRDARVLTVTSDNHATVRTMSWDDLQSERDYRPLKVYNRTKLMNVWFTQALGRALASTRITANCVSPGFVRTGLARDLGGAFGLFIRLAAPFQSAAATAALAVAHLASSPEMSGHTGGYYRTPRNAARPTIAEPSGLATDTGSAGRLWQLSADLVGIADPATT